MQSLISKIRETANDSPPRETCAPAHSRKYFHNPAAQPPSSSERQSGNAQRTLTGQRLSARRVRKDERHKQSRHNITQRPEGAETARQHRARE